MKTSVSILLLLLLLLGFLTDRGLAAEEPSVDQIMANLQRQSPSGEDRVRFLVQLARMNDASTLVHFLESGSPMQREFASQSLGMIPVPAAAAELKRASDSKELGLARYAKRALRNLRNPSSPSLQAQLASYDLRRINSVRVGATAPDFTLLSARGREIRLSGYRGKKTVLLEFNGAYD